MGWQDWNEVQLGSGFGSREVFVPPDVHERVGVAGIRLVGHSIGRLHMS